jgi:hypothetical protein
VRRVIGRIAPAILAAGRQPLVYGVVLAGLVLYFIYHVTRFRLARLWPLETFGDASILFEASRKVFQLGDYPARLATGTMNQVFPYPPPAAILFDLLGAAGAAPFMAAWLLFMFAALFVSLRASLAGEGREFVAAWPLVGAIALLFADSPVAWDLRNANSNLVCLALALGAFALLGKRPALAGTLVGLSISLKLFGILLLPWLLWRGPRRALIAASIALLALWLVLPALVFGVEGTIRLYASWREQLRIIADPWIYTFIQMGIGPPLVSVRRAAMTLTGEGPETTATLVAVAVLWAIWIAALAWYALRAFGSRIALAPSRAALADWTVLLLAPLPFNPWLEPYHAIPIVPGLVLLVVLALDEKFPPRERMTALAALAAFAIVRMLGVPFAIRAIGILAGFLVLVAALGFLRPRLAVAPEAAPALSRKRPARSARVRRS